MVSHRPPRRKMHDRRREPVALGVGDDERMPESTVTTREFVVPRSMPTILLTRAKIEPRSA